MLDAKRTAHPAAQRILLANTVASAALLVGLVAAFHAYASRLALAQAADSFSDIFTATALLVSIRVAALPADDNHPIGHQRAEPIAALVAAVIAGVLAVEVLRDAIGALVTGARPVLDLPLLAIFLAKIAAKITIAVLSARRNRKRPSPALRALFVDARNDVVVGSLSVAGFFTARHGWPSLDAWLAIPIALWVGWSGFGLARENISLLMGEAPPEERRSALLAIVRAVPGVRSAHDLRARFLGLDLDVLVHVVVDPDLTVRRAHDIGHAVERRLIEERDVCHAVAHVDVEDGDED
jgi:ferrous-iron efflux pump FieF